MRDAERRTLPFWIAIAAWAATVLVLNAFGAVVNQPSRPPLLLLAAVTGPPIAFAVAYAASERVRAISRSLDLQLLTAIQAWRVIGAMFLVLMSYGLLPGLFAWPAGLGDLIVGAYAP